MEQEEKKDGNYALNNWKDIYKYDPLRLLDLGNDFQVLLSANKPEIDEEARAISNFEKLTEDRHRPVSHTLVDSARLVPDVASVLGPALFKAGIKTIGKAATKAATKDVAKKLVKERTSDAAQAFSTSKFLPREEKAMASRKWVRDLLENKNAMERVADKTLSDKEVEAVRKNIKELVPQEIDKYNAGVDELKDIYEDLLKRIAAGYTPEDIPHILKEFETKDDVVKYLRANRESLGLTGTEYKELLKNFDALPDTRVSKAHLPADKVIDATAKDNVLKNIKEVPQYIPSMLPGLAEKAVEAGLNDLTKTKLQTNNNVEMKPDYWTQGSKPTPVSDFIASVFNVDFDDPARFNKKDVDAFFEFLEDIGTIEPGIKDKWTARQKVSVLREMMSDKDYGSYVKERWANSEHRKNWKKSYSGE